MRWERFWWCWCRIFIFFSWFRYACISVSGNGCRHRVVYRSICWLCVVDSISVRARCVRVRRKTALNCWSHASPFGHAYFWRCRRLALKRHGVWVSEWVCLRLSNSHIVHTFHFIRIGGKVFRRDAMRWKRSKRKKAKYCRIGTGTCLHSSAYIHSVWWTFAPHDINFMHFVFVAAQSVARRSVCAVCTLSCILRRRKKGVKVWKPKRKAD